MILITAGKCILFICFLIQSFKGLNMQLLRMDAPAGYIYRLTREEPLAVPRRLTF